MWIAFQSLIVSRAFLSSCGPGVSSLSLFSGGPSFLREEGGASGTASFWGRGSVVPVNVVAPDEDVKETMVSGISTMI